VTIHYDPNARVSGPYKEKQTGYLLIRVFIEGKWRNIKEHRWLMEKHLGRPLKQTELINHINHESDKHIVTIEDPLEFIHPSKKCLVTQREVGSHTASFAAALRAVTAGAVLVGHSQAPHAPARVEALRDR
jgi:hypothetical protein